MDSSNEIKHDKQVGTREDYEACLVEARKKGYAAVYNAVAEEGYDPAVDWRSLLEGIMID